MFLYNIPNLDDFYNFGITFNSTIFYSENNNIKYVVGGKYMGNKNIGLANRNKQSKKEFDKIIEANYELGDEYYKDVEQNRQKMKKRK